MRALLERCYARLCDQRNFTIVMPVAVLQSGRNYFPKDLASKDICICRTGNFVQITRYSLWETISGYGGLYAFTGVIRNPQQQATSDVLLIDGQIAVAGMYRAIVLIWFAFVAFVEACFVALLLAALLAKMLFPASQLANHNVLELVFAVLVGLFLILFGYVLLALIKMIGSFAVKRLTAFCLLHTSAD